MNEADVIAAWDNADPVAIHPTRTISEEAYWESGRIQAEALADLLPRKGAVLDYGCGDGRVAIPLHELGFKVTGADTSPKMLDLLEERAPHVPTFQIEDHGTQPGGFAAVYCLAVLIHHDFADGRKIVKDIRDTTHVGGLMILDWPTSDGPHERQAWNQVTYWSQADQDNLAEELGMRRVENPGVPFKVFKVVKKV